MGSGKGSVDYCSGCKPGTVILEISAIPKKLLEPSLAAYKLPIKTKFIIKDNID
jgi:ribosomal protein L16/L10AE